jgi:hypothetical protein
VRDFARISEDHHIITRNKGTKEKYHA